MYKVYWKKMTSQSVKFSLYHEALTIKRVFNQKSYLFLNISRSHGWKEAYNLKTLEKQWLKVSQFENICYFECWSQAKLQFSFTLLFLVLYLTERTRQSWRWWTFKVWLLFGMSYSFLTHESVLFITVHKISRRFIFPHLTFPVIW